MEGAEAVLADRAAAEIVSTGLIRLLALIWALPTTSIGLVFLAVAAFTGGRVARLGHVLEVHGGMVRTLLERGPLSGARIAAVTLGHVVLARNPAELERTRTHERVHVAQCERWGPLFLPAYAAASLWTLLRRADPYRDNWFERQAFAIAEQRSRSGRYVQRRAAVVPTP